MIKSTVSVFSVLLLTGTITGCSTSRYPGSGYPFPRTERGEEQRKGGDRDYPLSSLGVPKGHLPPPGECKVWFPGKPPGQQPPPQSCASALRSAPLGAWVITHEGGRYKVNIFSRTRQNVVDEVRYYSAQE
ncbi:hypothetical protein POKO110462_17725 [Pontibacter korlensis]|uniref:Lipoprotein n=1 Tax=Pontibacter korlensis TaxID=400092 RepID=A0A0E3UYE1_9BACT|nr:hypothetical protein [Pontibacter korlensis]AKD05037.1 hypothetical protein PKOR_20635 [Pontibacter korlensis]